MSELSEREIKNITRAFVRRSMGVGRKKGGYEAVRILYNRTDPSCEKFAQKVEEECWTVGAHTILLGYSSQRQKMDYVLKPTASLRKMNPFSEALARNADVSIYIGEEDDPLWAEGLALKLRLTAPNRQKLRGILDKRKVRWAYFGWPIPGASKSYGIPVKRFRQIFFNSIRKSFGRELRRYCEFYRKALAGGDKVKITADDGTDLRFRIKGRPVLVDDGAISSEDIARGDVGLNIPSGEVFVAPLETSADGRISFENVAIPGFGKLRGLELTFRRGKVVDYTAESGIYKFARFLKANTGEKDRIAELGIGTNPGAEYTGGSIIVDEKIFGTIHIAIGNNLGSYHGRNKASSHLDMIKNMKGGQVFVDGKLILNRGDPVD